MCRKDQISESRDPVKERQDHEHLVTNSHKKVETTNQQKKNDHTNRIQVKSSIPESKPVSTTAARIANAPSVQSSTASTTSTANDGPRRLHVTNLPFKTKDNELRAMFEEHGVVVDAEIIYNERGSKGFGFVTMETAEAATKAREALNGKAMDGRKIEVNNATPRTNQNKSVAQTKNRPSIPNQVMGLINNAQVQVNVPNLPVGWNAALTPPTLPGNQFQFPFSPQIAATVNTIPTFNLTAPNPSAPFSGLSCFPTPEQYAQYYNFISSQGPFRSTNTAASFRYQPY